MGAKTPPAEPRDDVAQEADIAAVPPSDVAVLNNDVVLELIDD